MSSLGLPFLLMAALAVLPLVLAPVGIGMRGSPTRAAVEAEPLGQAMLVTQQALLAWARANPGIHGPVPTTSLSLSTPWQAPYQVSTLVDSTASGPMAVTWYAGARIPAGPLADALIKLHANAGDVGLTGQGVLASPSGAITPLPAGVPPGMAAVADPVD